jgi:hypothetical protein
VRLLAERARLDAKADQLGIAVNVEELRLRVNQTENEGPPGSEGVLRYEADTVRAALLDQKLYAFVTSRVTVSDAEVRAYHQAHERLYPQPLAEVARTLRIQLLAARKTAAMKRWEAQVARELPVRFSS